MLMEKLRKTDGNLKMIMVGRELFMEALYSEFVANAHD